MELNHQQYPYIALPDRVTTETANNNKSSMEPDNLDKIFQDIQDKIDSWSKIDRQRFAGYFKRNHGEKWATLSEENKQKLLNEIETFIDDPKNKFELGEFKEKFSEYKSTRSNIIILFLGVWLGVSGNLVANLLDRDLHHFGIIYDVIVTVVFFLSIWYIYRQFIKKVEKEITRDKAVNEFISIFEKVDSNY